MKFNVLLNTAFKDIIKNKKRSLLTMLGIIIGIAAVITIIAIGRGFQDYVVDSLMGGEGKELSVAFYFQPENPTNSVGSNTSVFTEKNIRDISQITDVVKVESDPEQFQNDLLNVSIQKNDGKMESAFAKPVEETESKIVKGRAITKLDGDTNQKVAVITQKLADEMFENEDPINKTVLVKNDYYVIVGIKENNAATNLFVMGNDVDLPKETLKSRQPKNNNSISMINVILKNGTKVQDKAKEIQEYLEKNGPMKAAGSYSFVDIAKQIEGISSVLGSVTIFISLIAAISLLIAGIGMMNMMYISVAERIKEIGIRRAIGAKKKEILHQFMLEGIIVTVIGGIIGYIIGMVAAFIASKFLPFPIKLELMPVLISLGISLGIGIVFTYSPANTAANKNVIDII
ncbi:ABC transporter permease [Finegoldia magna]|uniref:Efflux ABC transporter, permease protein n=1 Tax=Finegoldia magna ATCC 53516 TaxID=525282 RepID=D6SBH3_FINMA|nr:ABC transporter permease [Finegoldia magna]EFH92823.1 efflux ABC transporter, permease protein [Finegoldia magna ATCC 53516]MDU4278005.1 ABC transporter permease [Finegoldia magna]